MKKLIQEKNKLDFAGINPADILFLTHHVQVSRRKAVPLTTSRERFLEAVYDAQQKVSEKEAAQKRYEADKAEQEVLRQSARAERDQMIVDCETCPEGKKQVLMGYTRILAEKDRAKRVCNRCFKLRGEYLAQQKAKEDRRAADKAAEEWLVKNPAKETVVIQLPSPKSESNNATTFNSQKGIEVVKAMLAQAKAAEAAKPKAKRKPKSISAELEAKPVAKKPRVKRAPEMAATA